MSMGSSMYSAATGGKSPLQIPSGSKSPDYIGMGAEAGGIALRIPAMIANRRAAKKEKKAQKKEEQYQMNKQLEQNQLNQSYMLEDLEKARGGELATNEGKHQASGNIETSYEGDINTDFDQDRSRRLNALALERAAIRHGAEFASRMRRLADQRAKMQQMYQYIGTGVELAGQLAGGFMGPVGA